MKPEHDFAAAAAVDTAHADQLAQDAAGLGYEIVDIDGFLSTISEKSAAQNDALAAMRSGVGMVTSANGSVQDAVKSVTDVTAQVLRDVSETVADMRSSGARTKDLAAWVTDIANRVVKIEETLKAVRASNNDIASISKQVNILAINAKIEAARAGQAGLGFAVVAEAINELSQKTAAAAGGISRNVTTLSDWMDGLRAESGDVSSDAMAVTTSVEQADIALGGISKSVERTDEHAHRISNEASSVEQAIRAFGPAFEQMQTLSVAMAEGVEKAHTRVTALIDRSERIVQGSAAIGGASEDAPLIAHVVARAAKISEMFDQGVAEGRITAAQLLSKDYAPIPGTDPQQVKAPFTEFTDAILPDLLEEALDLDPRVVFCAAVNTQGYLPTHNKKFSHPQSKDPVWNMSHCRNRRIFDDRVGLKAGTSTAPFLLQVYRRDMGGGTFAVMKDLSAPITVGGQHWGGLRLAFSF